MQAVIEKTTFHTALGVVIGAAAKKPNVPVLANVLLGAQKGGLTLTATDLDRYVVCRVRCTVAESGEITLPARLTNEVVNALPADDITITLRDDNVELACADARSTLSAISAGEFPLIPNVRDSARSVGMAAHEFARAVEQVIVAAAGDEARPILTGILFQFDGRTLTLAAADGFRLAARTLSTDRDVSEPFEVVIPVPAMADVARFCRKFCPAQATVMLDLSENYARFDMPTDPDGNVSSVEVIARLLDGKFPDYKLIVPSDQSIKTTVTVERAAILRAIALPKIFAQRSSLRVLMLDVQRSGIVIAADSEDNDDGRDQVAATVSGDELTIAVNSTFLESALKLVDAEQVTLGLTSYNSPLRLCPTAGIADAQGKAGYHVHVIMPMLTTEMRERAAEVAKNQEAASAGEGEAKEEE